MRFVNQPALKTPSAKDPDRCIDGGSFFLFFFFFFFSARYSLELSLAQLKTLRSIVDSYTGEAEQKVPPMSILPLTPSA